MALQLKNDVKIEQVICLSVPKCKIVDINHSLTIMLKIWLIRENMLNSFDSGSYVRSRCHNIFLLKFNLLFTHVLYPWWLRWWGDCLQWGRPWFDPWVRKIPWRRKWQPTPVFLPGESPGRRNLVGYSPQGCKESDITERHNFLSFFLFSLYFIPVLGHP